MSWFVPAECKCYAQLNQMNKIIAQLWGQLTKKIGQCVKCSGLLNLKCTFSLERAKIITHAEAQTFDRKCCSVDWNQVLALKHSVTINTGHSLTVGRSIC